MREGRADVAAIDCVTYARLEAVAPQEIAPLRVIARSASAPALPYVTRRDIAPADLQKLRDGLQAAIADPALAEARAALLIAGIEIVPLQAYDRLLEMEREAERAAQSVSRSTAGSRHPAVAAEPGHRRCRPSSGAPCGCRCMPPMAPACPARGSAWMIYGVPAVLVLPFILRDGGRGLMAGGWPLLWLGISTGICNYLYAASVVYGDVARIVLLFYVNPVWSVLLERIVLKTRDHAGPRRGIGGRPHRHVHPELRRRRTAAAAQLRGVGRSRRRLLLGGRRWSRMRMTPQVGMMEKAFLQYVTAMIFGGAILALGIFPAQTDWSAVNWPVAILWIAIVAGIWVVPGLLLSFWAAARLSPTRASMLFMAEVVVGRGDGGDLDRLSVRLARGDRRPYHRLRQCAGDPVRRPRADRFGRRARHDHRIISTRTA